MILVTHPQTRMNDVLELDFEYSGPSSDVVSKNIPPYPVEQYKDNSSRSNNVDILDWYSKFALDIVAETVFDYPYAYISEKTLRPILHKRPFIIVGAAHTLYMLRHKGFQTFDMIIDETYDTILDPAQRFHSVCKSITNFTMQPLEKIRNDVAAISNVLEHNHTHLKNLEDIEIKQLEML